MGAYCKLLVLTWGLIRAGGLIEGRGLNRGFTVSGNMKDITVKWYYHECISFFRIE